MNLHTFQTLTTFAGNCVSNQEIPEKLMTTEPPVITPRAQSQYRMQEGRKPWRRLSRAYLSLSLLFLLMALLDLPAASQDIPRIQVFGGYSYLRFDTRSFGFAGGSNLNGYNLAPAFNIIHGFGVAGELSGQYGNHLNLRDVVVGPQILYPRNNLIFSAHVLYGDARTFVRTGNGVGNTAHVLVAGGGADLNMSPHFSIRVLQVDYLRSSLFHGTQNNFRISTGLVYRWGTIKEKKHKLPGTGRP